MARDRGSGCGARAKTAVMPGVVQIRAGAPGREPAERRLTLPAGDSETVTLTLPVAKDAAAPSPPTPGPAAGPQGGGDAVGPAEGAPASGEAEPEGGGGLSLRGWGFITAGVGLAGAAVFIGAGVAANDRYAEIDAACGSRSCPDPSYDDRIETGRTLDTVANIGLGVGLAGLVAGAIMILAGGEDEPSPPVAVQALGRALMARCVF